MVKGGATAEMVGSSRARETSRVQREARREVSDGRVSGEVERLRSEWIVRMPWERAQWRSVVATSRGLGSVLLVFGGSELRTMGW
jgi:hypothetical protein